MVLLKGFGKDGFRFFTNFESRKGQELVRVHGKSFLGLQGPALAHWSPSHAIAAPTHLPTVLRHHPACGPLHLPFSLPWMSALCRHPYLPMFT